MQITSRDQLAPAISKIRQDVYAAAKEEHWPLAELQEKTLAAIRRFADQLDSERKFEWAAVVRQLYCGQK